VKFWTFRKKKESAPPVDGQTLPDIVRGMQHAVNTAQQILQQHWRDTLDPYFDDATGEPVTQKYKLPSGHVIEMPLIALVQPQGLALDHMEIEMSVRIDQTEVKPHRSASQEETHQHRTSFKCSFAPVKNKEDRALNSVMVKMIFKAGDPPEAVARLIEEFTNTTMPRADSGPKTAGGEPPVTPPTPPDKGPMV
jgi:DNA-binding protein Fis